MLCSETAHARALVVYGTKTLPQRQKKAPACKKCQFGVDRLMIKYSISCFVATCNHKLLLLATM